MIRASIKILEEDKTFTGMPELYYQISQGEPFTNKFVIVSAISNWFDNRIEKFLKTSNFPSNQRYLRNWLREWSIENFKISKITEIIKEYPNRKFIVIFDNSDASIILAEKLQVDFPGAISAIYLRKVIEKRTPSGAISFFTSFDIALNEFKLKRMSDSELIAVGSVILSEKVDTHIFPDYALCPKGYDPCQNIENNLMLICSKVKDRVQEACKDRQ